MKPLIVANWKMNPQNLAEAKQLFNSVKKGIKNIKNAEVVICPPFVYLFNLKSTIENLQLGAQNCFWEDSGNFTGEISPKMLKHLSCQYIIIGHSERRKYFGETNEIINKKIKSALKERLKPILCIGETKKERRLGQTFKVLKKQLQIGLKNTKYPEAEPRSTTSWLRDGQVRYGAGKIQDIKYLVVAYEPVWAIGTGNPCHLEDAKTVYLFLRKILKKNQILYGGSVNSQNAKDYIKEAGFQGLLVGGASLNSKEFIDIIKSMHYIK